MNACSHGQINVPMDALPMDALLRPSDDKRPSQWTLVLMEVLMDALPMTKTPVPMDATTTTQFHKRHVPILGWPVLRQFARARTS